MTVLTFSDTKDIHFVDPYSDNFHIILISLFFYHLRYLYLISKEGFITAIKLSQVVIEDAVKRPLPIN